MLTRAEVLAAARLAQLSLGPEDIERVTDELSAILEQVELLQPFLTSHAAPHAVTQRTTLRSDVPGPDGLAVPPSYLAPEWRDGFFTVPRLPPHDAAE